MPCRALVTASPRIRASASLTSGPTSCAGPVVANVTATPVRAAITTACRARTRSSGSSGARARCSIAQRESCRARSAATTISAASSRSARRRMKASSCATPSCRSRAIRRRSRAAARAATAAATSRTAAHRSTTQNRSRSTSPRCTHSCVTGGSSAYSSIENAKNREASPRRRANASPARIPRPVRPIDAAARLNAIVICSAMAASGWLSSVRVRSACGGRSWPRHSSRTSSTGTVAASSPASTTATIATAAVPGRTRRRAGANAPTPTSSEPTSIPVSATIPRGSPLTGTASMAASAALVAAMTASPAAMIRRSSRGPSRQRRTTMAVAIRPIRAVPVSSATCSDGAGYANRSGAARGTATVATSAPPAAIANTSHWRAKPRRRGACLRTRLLALRRCTELVARALTSRCSTGQAA